ncbi:hypothetical protein HYH03_010503 [Edaphochlamys debaryana]|uniref:Uncharacterized protein n=1 Tax=Edaphochlamys debaryana TaxID=47281 RepID=A0A835XTU1_9CHLO|nr:hypothetical protein HYH03_010503 [Edaphochlamys debaryana]|eukprot:KAG2491057.1 hypothetical protein HYH03_010503 [Edaphochlamys debaryana]
MPGGKHQRWDSSDCDDSSNDDSSDDLLLQCLLSQESVKQAEEARDAAVADLAALREAVLADPVLQHLQPGRAASQLVELTARGLGALVGPATDQPPPLQLASLRAVGAALGLGGGEAGEGKPAKKHKKDHRSYHTGKGAVAETSKEAGAIVRELGATHGGTWACVQGAQGYSLPYRKRTLMALEVRGSRLLVFQTAEASSHAFVYSMNRLLLLGVFLASFYLRPTHPASIFGLEYDPKDFVVAQPSCVHRVPLTKFTRKWRGGKEGIRSFVLLNNSALVDELNSDPASKENLETYGFYEDDSVEGGSWRGGNVGDTRAAVTPFLAHKHFGETYKWMLYGDDDTLFYMPGVLKLLAHFDPNQPLAITDNLWYYSAHPTPYAPRCLPCGFNLSTIATNHSFNPRPACPFCTRAFACATYGPRYHCNATHRDLFAAELDPRVTTPSPPPAARAAEDREDVDGRHLGGAGAAASAALPPAERSRRAAAMRSLADSFSAWMATHYELQQRWLRHDDFKYKPAMDWEMREGPEPWQLERDRARAAAKAAKAAAAAAAAGAAGAAGGEGTGPGVAGEGAAATVAAAVEVEEEEPPVEDRFGRRLQGALREALGLPAEGARSSRRRRRRGAGATDGVQEPGGPEGVAEEGDGEAEDADWDDGSLDGQGGEWAAPGARRRRRLLRSVARDRQRFTNGTAWLSYALGRDIGPAGGPEGAALRESLRLPHPFCVEHDERLHSLPAANCHMSISGHGGTGILFSVGLMRLLAPEAAVAFIKSQTGCGGGDCLLGRAIVARMGLGFTDPGTPLQAGADKLDRYARFIDSNTQMPSLLVLADPVAALLKRGRGSARAPGCDRACVWLLENVVGTHVRAHSRQVESTVASLERHLVEHEKVYGWIQEARKDPAVQAGNMTVVRWIQQKYGGD